ncbi:MAG: hypothetical protein H7178_12635 [Chitinophagaceae bacterium]|nr:hypothetical protein [Chitinophagaceae bacterium]
MAFLCLTININAANWLVNHVAEAGDAGGNLMFAGIPKDLKKVKASWTGKFL